MVQSRTQPFFDKPNDFLSLSKLSRCKKHPDDGKQEETETLPDSEWDWTKHTILLKLFLIEETLDVVEQLMLQRFIMDLDSTLAGW